MKSTVFRNAEFWDVVFSVVVVVFFFIAFFFNRVEYGTAHCILWPSEREQRRECTSTLDFENRTPWKLYQNKYAARIRYINLWKFLVFSELYEITTLRLLSFLFRLKGIRQKIPALDLIMIRFLFKSYSRCSFPFVSPRNSDYKIESANLATRLQNSCGMGPKPNLGHDYLKLTFDNLK